MTKESTNQRSVTFVELPKVLTTPSRIASRAKKQGIVGIPVRELAQTARQVDVLAPDGGCVDVEGDGNCAAAGAGRSGRTRGGGRGRTAGETGRVPACRDCSITAIEGGEGRSI